LDIGNSIRDAEDVATTTNAISVDVEDYFQVAAFDQQVAPDDWSKYPQRVRANTFRFLEIFAEYGVKATFFTLGWVAERHPEIVRAIVAEGHELASHGYAHQPAFRQDPEVFRADVVRAKHTLEQAAGIEVIGYRAPSFSIIAVNDWAFSVLEECGHRYSSSVYPIRHDLYGFPDAPRFPFVPKGTGILECPQSTIEIGPLRMPCGGGGYFRLLPYGVFRRAIRRINEVDGKPMYFYLHPWELDPGQPRIKGAGMKSRFRHYLNLHRTESRLRRALQEFRWDRFDRVLDIH